MRINEDTCVSTQKLVLVPYSAHHVPKYHEWMKDPEIQEATASEPLTLDQEYSMQRTWRNDGDKLTFIICRPFNSNRATASENQSHDHGVKHTVSIAKDERILQPEIDAMIGDVNLFITEWENEDSTDQEDTVDENVHIAGELELMIASLPHQRQGYGKASLLTFLTYIIRHERDILQEFHRERLSCRHDPQPPFPDRFCHFCVKIGRENHRSIKLFEGLGFVKTEEQANYFGEFELRLLREGVEDVIRRAMSEETIEEGVYR